MGYNVGYMGFMWDIYDPGPRFASPPCSGMVPPHHTTGGRGGCTRVSWQWMTTTPHDHGWGGGPRTWNIYGEFLKCGYPKMVGLGGKIHLQMDDLGVPLFQETLISLTNNGHNCSFNLKLSNGMFFGITNRETKKMRS